ncbi:MAG: thermonuclease family protein [Pseudanabaena sp. M57BS1SP1A06MG]|nr:thermonuclease family protein [Pseudanabaena sp. M34BS1SP1A06MG]MCA6590660.1 thermonuclease family protein [Pseudanabaena sp. M38BS1SP1A06MG]MCA6599742.1 thermonuclease family protein [Pseudanabaena sp. M57BS1SP1A06MG]
MKKFEGLITAVVIVAIASFFVHQSKLRDIAARPSYEGNEAAIAKPIIESKSLECNLEKVSDGDTIAVNCNGEKLKIRFCGIDAPEKAQPLGKESRELLDKLTNQDRGKLIVYPIEKDRYGRTVAEVEVYSGKKTEKGDRINLFINSEMVRAGLAYHYKQYSGNCPNKEAIAYAEDDAKKEKLGVWSGNYQKPWDYRKAKR